MPKQYYKSSAESIIKDVYNIRAQRCANILGIELLIDPFVFPSDHFRTTNFLINSLKNLFKGKRICDMGCGAGIIGIVAIYEGADYAVQIDINPYAVQNAKSNRNYHSFDESKLKIYESNCFSRVPFQLFDLIVFNIPFHSDDVEIKNLIERAFIDPNFESVENFLKQAKNYLSLNGQIIIAFSDKGNVKLLESLFSKYHYEWKIFAQINTNQKYDNRLYSLTLKNN